MRERLPVPGRIPGLLARAKGDRVAKGARTVDASAVAGPFGVLPLVRLAMGIAYQRPLVM